MDTIRMDKPKRLAALAALALLAALSLGACSGTAERNVERTGDRAKEDVREMRDYLHQRGVTIDTRPPGPRPGY
jgi:hypothetical protein